MDFPSENWVYNDWDDFDTASANVVGDYTLEIFAQLRNTGRILDNFLCVRAGPDPGTLQGRPRGIQSRQRATRFCTGELFIPFLQNQLAAKFEVPSINNQSYFQHTIITLADSNFFHSFLHSFIHNSIIQSIICFLSF
jgi:hypothetical protein